MKGLQNTLMYPQKEQNMRGCSHEKIEGEKMYPAMEKARRMHVYASMYRGYYQFGNISFRKITGVKHLGAQIALWMGDHCTIQGLK